ncbi:MAG: 7-cyano-7-deazaguanine synthase QueC [Ruminococcus sp.]|nr:7-cyano-7-deazaguanine synthase QueC [Ruminococcus sp.]
MKCLVLLSGGVDSTTALAEAVLSYGAKEVVALIIFYGQKHKKEVEAAEKIAEYYGVSCRKIDISAIFEGMSCPLLSGGEGDIPHESYAKQLEKTDGAPVATYVPFRNGLFISCAAAAAIGEGCECLIYGAHADDSTGNAYPDTSPAFNRAMNDAVFIGSGNAIKLYAPFEHMNKAEVVKRGIKLKVPYEMTWSCYEGGETPCGVCGTCIDRKKAFEANGLNIN